MNGRTDGLEVRRATAADIDDIVELLQANEATRGGTLTGHFDRTTIIAALDDMPIVIARHRDRLAGVLISSLIAASRHMPVIAQMLNTYRGGPNAYIYGPICIDRRERGQGLAEKLLEYLKSELPGREGILFIRQNNVASIRVHQDKLGMAPRGAFEVDAIGYVVLSYRG